ncbi:hypothetical protein VTO42DRAFT_5525 [Malbranchea cinnamomea]
MATTTGPNSTSTRQSTRQIRTNPSRLSKTAGRTSLLAQQHNAQAGFGHSSSSMAVIGGGYSAGAGGSGAFNPVPPGALVPGGIPHGMYPGITHFTDTIFAIPREFRRHESLLKEVDGKSWALEERLPLLIGEASRRIMEPAKNEVRPGEETEFFEKAAGSQTELPEVTARRQLFQHIRNTLQDLLPTLDEKNHVARNANRELRKQMHRLETAYAHVQTEISEETRLGNINHWAYSNKATAKTTGSERPRREAANRDRDAERETVGTRKQRRNQPDQEDDTRAKKTVTTKGKGVEAPSADAAAPAKRRKVEKTQPAPTSAAMERTASTNTNAGRAGTKDADTAKRRTRAPNATSTAAAAAATTTQRKRTNTVTSTAGSPSASASPLVSAAGLAGKAASPAPSITQRPSSSRLHNTTQTNGRQRPSSSASNRPPSKKPPEGKVSQSSSKSDQAESGLNGNGRPSKQQDTASKREEIASGLSIVTKAEANPASEVHPTPSKGRSSKTSTPVSSTFAESQQQQQIATTQRSRPTRSTEGVGGGPAKRSHKKGASNVSTARQLAAAAAEEEDASHQGDDEDEEAEPLYCYCNQVSYGEMVACDNANNCPREWFHLACVGLAKPPGKSEVWYCNECREALEAKKSTKTRSSRS